MANAPKKDSVQTASTASLISKVAKEFDSLPKKMTKDLLQSFLTMIEENVAAGVKVRIDKVGILQVKDRAPRMGRNPQTGEEISIPARKKITFRTSSTLKEAMGVKKSSKSKSKSRAC